MTDLTIVGSKHRFTTFGLLQGGRVPESEAWGVSLWSKVSQWVCHSSVSTPTPTPHPKPRFPETSSKLDCGMRCRKPMLLCTNGLIDNPSTATRRSGSGERERRRTQNRLRQRLAVPQLFLPAPLSKRKTDSVTDKLNLKQKRGGGAGWVGNESVSHTLRRFSIDCSGSYAT